MDILDLDRKKYKDLRLGELTTATIKEYGYVPDVFIDRESGKKNNIRILGKTPEDVLAKLKLFL